MKGFILISMHQWFHDIFHKLLAFGRMKNLGLTRESTKVCQFLKCMLIMLRFMKIWIKKQTWKKSETTRLLLLTLVFAHKVFPPLPRSTMVSQKSLLNLKMAAIFQWKWILFPVLQTLPNVVYIYFRNICVSRKFMDKY